MAPYGLPLKPDQLDEWMRLRFGPADGQPIYWHATGLVRNASSGEPLYTFEYYDVSRQIRDPARPDVRIGVARKFDAFRDKETNALFETPDGKPIAPLLYPYQMFEYEVVGDAARSLVTQGSGDQLRRIPGAGDVLRKTLGDYVQYTAPSHFPFYHASLPAFEDVFTITVNYLSGQGSSNPLHTWGISIVSRWPPWAGGDGKALVTSVLSGGGYGAFEMLPTHIQGFVQTELSAWVDPPKDFLEVRRMQEDPSYLYR